MGLHMSNEAQNICLEL